MKHWRDRDSGLAALLGDVFAGGQPAPELLVRYADDPGSLSAEDRQNVELHLAQSPTYADQLKVLKNFDISPLDREAEPALEPVRTSLARRLGNIWAAIQRFFEISPVLAWAPVAVAGLLALLLYPGLFGSGSLEPVAPGARAPGQVALLPQDLQQDPPAPAPATPPPDTEAAPSAPDPAPKPARVMLAEVPDELRPTSPPAPEKPPEAAPPSKPTQAATPTPPAPKPERPQPIMLAMAIPTYRAPAGASPRFRPSGVVRGADSKLTLIAGVPEHVARTASEQPSLFWYLSELPRAGGEFEFVLTGEESPDPLFQTKLPTPSVRGLQRIDLSDFGVKLSPYVEFRWSVALRQDLTRPSRDIVAQGWIERIDAPPPVAARLDDAGRAEVPVIYAESGYWYEAMSTLSDLIELYPENESIRRARKELLKQVGLEPLAQALH